MDMSRVPPHAGDSRRRDRTGWLTMQSDANGLLTKFPENREFNREFFNFGPFSAILATNRRGNPMACSKIPDAAEQGIFSPGTGNLAALYCGPILRHPAELLSGSQ